MTEGPFFGGGGVDGEEEDVLRRINLQLQYTVLFLRGTGRGWFNLRVFWMVTCWGVKKFMNN